MNKLIEDSLKVLEDAEKDRDKKHKKKMEDLSIKFFGEEYLRNWLKYEDGCIKIIGTKFSLRFTFFEDSFYLAYGLKRICIRASNVDIMDLKSLGAAIKDAQNQEIPERKSWWKRFLG